MRKTIRKPVKKPAANKPATKDPWVGKKGSSLSRQSKKIAGASYTIIPEGPEDATTYVLSALGQSGPLGRFVCDSEATAKSVAQLIEDGKVLL